MCASLTVHVQCHRHGCSTMSDQCRDQWHGDIGYGHQTGSGEIVVFVDMEHQSRFKRTLADKCHALTFGSRPQAWREDLWTRHRLLLVQHRTQQWQHCSNTADVDSWISWQVDLSHSCTVGGIDLRAEDTLAARSSERCQKRDLQQSACSCVVEVENTHR
jgi:hypothetical protein